jgi:hypothetical protein
MGDRPVRRHRPDFAGFTWVMLSLGLRQIAKTFIPPTQAS